MVIMALIIEKTAYKFFDIISLINLLVLKNLKTLKKQKLIFYKNEKIW